MAEGGGEPPRAERVVKSAQRIRIRRGSYCIRNAPNANAKGAKLLI